MLNYLTVRNADWFIRSAFQFIGSQYKDLIDFHRANSKFQFQRKIINTIFKAASLLWIIFAVFLPLSIKNDGNIAVHFSQMSYLILVIDIAFTILIQIKRSAITQYDIFTTPVDYKKFILYFSLSGSLKIHSLSFPGFLISFGFSNSLAISEIILCFLIGCICFLSYKIWSGIVILWLESKDKLNLVLQWIFIIGSIGYYLPVAMNRPSLYYCIPFSGLMGFGLNSLINNRSFLFILALALISFSIFVGIKFSRFVFYPFKSFFREDH